LVELVVAKRNEIWARKRGAIEYGQGHYRYIVLLHTMFLISIIAEYFYREGSFNIVMLLAFIFLTLIKVWIIASLGKYWNTKILRIPGSAFIKKGPYKLFRHPNYFIVVCEIIIIPMVFNLYITAIIFTALNIIMLTIRIKEEEKAWAVS
jgi:methyltransferase